MAADKGIVLPQFMSTTAPVNGFFAPGFEEVRVEFERTPEAGLIMRRQFLSAGQSPRKMERLQSACANSLVMKLEAKLRDMDYMGNLGYACVMNTMDYYLGNDPLERALRDAVYRTIVH